MVFIVNDLLRLTEAEDVGFQIHKENLNLRASIAEVMVAFEDEASRKDLSIQGEYDYAVPGTVKIDPSGLRKVLSTLLGNVLQNSKSGNILVKLHHIDNTEANHLIAISFKDEGVGLSEEELDRCASCIEIAIWGKG